MQDMIAQIKRSNSSLVREFDIIAHNLANAGTIGYKRRYNEFSRILNDRIGQEHPKPSSVGGSNLAVDFSQGNIIETGRSMDFALDGHGFFVIETPDGPLYTRNGKFHSNANGQIVDLSGRLVAGANGPITIPPNISYSQIVVSADGSVSADGVAIGQFKLVNFKEQEKDLLPAGLNCFWASPELKPQKAEGVNVKQYHNESSNVKMMEEMVDMIMVSRLYESNMKFVGAKRQMSNSIIGVAKG